MLDETGHSKWAEVLLQIGVRRFSNLAGIEGVAVLMCHVPGLTCGEASELILEARDRRPVSGVPAVRQQCLPVVAGLVL